MLYILNLHLNLVLQGVLQCYYSVILVLYPVLQQISRLHITLHICSAAYHLLFELNEGIYVPAPGRRHLAQSEMVDKVIIQIHLVLIYSKFCICPLLLVHCIYTYI